MFAKIALIMVMVWLAALGVAHLCVAAVSGIVYCVKQKRSGKLAIGTPGIITIRENAALDAENIVYSVRRERYLPDFSCPAVTLMHV